MTRKPKSASATNALEQELHRERRFPDTRGTLDEVKPVRDKATAEHVIESGDTGGDDVRFLRASFFHVFRGVGQTKDL